VSVHYRQVNLSFNNIHCLANQPLETNDMPPRKTSLGFMYDNGQGVIKDDVQAYMWYLLAGSKGNEEARKNYGILEKELTDQQRADGQRMAREWKPAK
jgi:TPR repeat protein